ncbi:hypothetical protein FACS1894204_06050 [Synergistales bacterium]|nr:hypothetical protein FACS1894204_06050 [Synergistales bacterium]
MKNIRVRRRNKFSSLCGFIGAVLALSIWILPQIEVWILCVAGWLQSLGAAYPQIAEWLPSTELWPDFALNIVPPNVVGAAIVMKGNLSLFLIAGATALLVSFWNFIRGEDDFPAFLSAAPFITLTTGAVFWGLSLASGQFFQECKVIALPERGIAILFETLTTHITASKEFLILWTLSSVGSLIGLLAGMQGLRKKVVGWEGSVGVLLVLFAISSEIDPNFLRFANFLRIITQLSCAGIIALGMTFVIVSGGIDLSSSSMAMLLGFVMIGVTDHSLISFGGNTRDAFICALLVILSLGALLGLLSGLSIALTRTKPFIVTLAAAAIYGSISAYYKSLGVSVDANEFITQIGSYSPLFIPLSVWAFFLLAFLCGELMNGTIFGRCAAITGANEKRAVRIGVNVTSIKIISYILSGVITAVAAFFLVSRGENPGSAAFAFSLELDAIAAVLIGGTLITGGSGTIAGTVTGLMVLGLVNNLMDMFCASASLYVAVKGVLILASAMIYRPAPSRNSRL